MRWKLIGFLCGFFLTVFLLFYFYVDFTKDLDPPESRIPTGLLLMYSDGTPMMLPRSFWIELEDVPPYFLNALLVSEDKRFYYHAGVDPIGIARAIVRNISNMSISEGGSTITQQLARTLYLTPTVTWQRKVKEMFIALWLERHRTKEEILQMYINSVYMGNGLYGFASASRYYFGKELSDVTLNEAAILVGVVRSPENFNPLRSWQVSKRKAKTVLDALLREGYISELVHAKAVEELENMDYTRKVSIDMDEEIFWRVARELDRLGYGLNELRQGYRIYTTLDSTLSRAALSLPATVVAEAIDPMSGAVLLYKGVGLTYPEGRRLLGSAIKPFYYYLAVLEGWSTDSELVDLPLKVGDWTPENFDKSYRGIVTMRQALVDSLNIPSVNLFMQLGRENVVDFLKNELKIAGHYPEDMTIALGTLETAPEEVLKAYSAIFNGGVVLQPYVVKRIEDVNGRTIYEASPNVLNIVRARRLSPMEASAVLLSVMREVVEKGTGVRARQRVPVAGKTGTSLRTAWFVGGDQTFIMTVAVDGEDLIGGVHAAPVWSQLVSNYSYSGKMPKWKPQTQLAVKTTLPSLTLDVDRLVQWLREGTLSIDAMVEITSRLDGSALLDFLSSINERSPQLAKELWERIKARRSW
ncbi:MAG: Peptidoglycan glycosyltransferase [Thermotoga sp. 50_1627]|uniref:transglycosylase domain-containing protein n=1 Tax=Pseudothermotoga sp. TaxID=2033661 RepID=UPI00076CEEA1|nr:MAG: Peptidoglycan glycosyltransferase [Thermotoga sp. 50_1627]MBC7117214.1 penicillin-binding protein [Pseudothermotoga sp.]MDK2923855.1 penicillin-binding protein [Pseudothermotoga sp.]HBT39515.1 penicillin-binding protein [Pseudothermotoga sp.]HCO97408.1 penicillin-binding protein [Pseudothermotoga sp.]